MRGANRRRLRELVIDRNGLGIRTGIQLVGDWIARDTPPVIESPVGGLEAASVGDGTRHDKECHGELSITNGDHTEASTVCAPVERGDGVPVTVDRGTRLGGGDQFGLELKVDRPFVLADDDASVTGVIVASEVNREVESGHLDVGLGC